MTDKKPTGLDLMRVPFPDSAISKLPKPTARQTDTLKVAMKNGDFSLGIRCKECGGWHHKDVIHLDYVGHAALTDRLLDCDPNWNWEPVTFAESGDPKFDNIDGMWIKLTVCDVTRLGYGSADGKSGGNAIKEVIGDALRNAAMRFGAALDLWHKGDLHGDDEPPTDKLAEEKPKPVATITADEYTAVKAKMETAGVTASQIIVQIAATTLEEMPQHQFAAVMDKLNKAIAAKGKDASLADDKKYMEGK